MGETAPAPKKKTSSLTFVEEDDHGNNNDGADYDDFDYLEVLRWELAREKKENSGLNTIGKKEETEEEKFLKRQELRDAEVLQTVDLLVNNRKELIDMP